MVILLFNIHIFGLAATGWPVARIPAVIVAVALGLLFLLAVKVQSLFTDK